MLLKFFHGVFQVMSRHRLYRARALGTAFSGGMLLAVVAQGAEQEWSVSDFERIVIKGSPSVRLMQGDEEHVSGEGSAKDLANLEVYVDDGTLIIEPKKSRGWSWGNDTPLLLDIQLKQLAALTLAGSGDVACAALAGADLEITLEGSGDLRFEKLQAEDLRVTLDGSGEFDLSGQVVNQEIEINGSGDYEAEALASETARIVINGSADVVVDAQSLDVLINGSGDVRYRGEPVVKQRVNGSGDIRAL